MNTLIRYPLSKWLIACAIFSMLLSACQPVNASTSFPPAQLTTTQLPADKPVTLVTQTPVQVTQTPSSTSGDITLDLSGVAQDQTVEMGAALPATTDSMWWAAGPQYRHVSLQGYPVSNHTLEPQIFIYPAGDLASANEAAGKVAADLQALLQARQAGDSLPFLPLINAKQVMHPLVQYLDFKSGKGVRFLTQFNQGIVRINNVQLIYTFQGLTSDSKYYIAAVLPVTHPDLPATQQVFAQTEAELKEYPAYMTKTITWLDQQPSGSFTPDLARLDALIQSIEVSVTKRSRGVGSLCPLCEAEAPSTPALPSQPFHPVQSA